MRMKVKGRKRKTHVKNYEGKKIFVYSLLMLVHHLSIYLKG